MRQLRGSMGSLVLVVVLLVLTTMVAAAQATHPRFAATLTGAAEVPAGDADGSGTAAILFQAANDVCFTLRVSNITLPAAAAHIHEGAAGVNGPIVIPLQAPDANGVAEGCTTGDPAVLTRIQNNPAGFYVNVHTSDFPQGAVRGQLAAQQEGFPGTPSTMPDTGVSDNSVLLVLSLAGLVLLGGIGLRQLTQRRIS